MVIVWCSFKRSLSMSQYTCKVSFKEPVHSWAFPKERELLMTWKQGDLDRLYPDKYKSKWKADRTANVNFNAQYFG